MRTLTLTRRFCTSGPQLAREEELLHQARDALNIWGGPTRPGRCCVVLPNFSTRMGHFEGTASNSSAADPADQHLWIVHLDGDATNVALHSSKRLFHTQDAATSIVLSCCSYIALVASATIGPRVTGSAKLPILALLITRGHTAAAAGACASTTTPSRVMIALCSSANHSILRHQFFRQPCLPRLFLTQTHDLL